MPGRLRVADVDQDGYPDFVLTLSFKDKSAGATMPNFTRSAILLNQSGEDGKRGLAQVKSSGDSFLSKVL